MVVGRRRCLLRVQDNCGAGTSITLVDVEDEAVHMAGYTVVRPDIVV